MTNNNIIQPQKTPTYEKKQDIIHFDNIAKAVGEKHHQNGARGNWYKNINPLKNYRRNKPSETVIHFYNLETIHSCLHINSRYNDISSESNHTFVRI